MVKKIKQSLGEMLLSNGLISQEQLDQARESTRAGQSLREVIISEGIISDVDLANFIAEKK